MTPHAADEPAQVPDPGGTDSCAGRSPEECEQLRRLIAEVVHEIRNPIAALRVNAEGMADGVLPPEHSRLEAVLGDVERLAFLVDDLQQLTLAESRGLAYRIGAVDIASLARAEADRAASLASGEVEIRYEGPTEPVMVDGDVNRLSQVLRNLLSNALRHTSRGWIRVSVGSSDGGRVEVAVHDSGEGISPEDLPHVFDRFYRSDKARSADAAGTGLGLAIVKRLVEDQGGMVFVASNPGEGATVGFSMPERA